MTLWSRFFRLLGGMGPEQDWDSLGPIRRRLRRWGVPGTVASSLCRWGFLKRDPAMLRKWPSPDAWYWINYRWQWRFWRGPYRDAREAWQRDRDRRDFRRGAQRAVEAIMKSCDPAKQQQYVMERWRRDNLLRSQS